MKHLYISIFFLLFSFNVRAQDSFQLAPPLLRYPSVFFTKEAVVEMVFAEAGTQIRYTLNGQEPNDKSPIYNPTETAIAPNGDIYVADGYGKDFIIQYSPKGEYIRHFGGKGDEAGHLNNAHGVCVDTRDKTNPCLIVSSRQQNAFKRYDLEGKYLDTIDMKGAWVCRPVVKGDYLYAAVLQSNSRQWQKSGFVTILDKDNQVVSNVAGSTPQYNGQQLEEMYQTIKAFEYPHDVLVDDEENLYVAQWNSGKSYPVKLEPVH